MTSFVRLNHLRQAAGTALYLNSSHVSKPLNLNTLQTSSGILLRPKPANFPLTPARTVSTKLVSEDGIIRSPYPDLDIPDVTLHDFVFQHSEGYEDLPAMEDFLSGKTYTYAQLKTSAKKVASSLHKMGYRKNDTILAFSPNLVDLSVTFFACISLGIVFTAYNPTAPPSELARALKMTGTKAVLTIPQLSSVVKSAIELLNKSPVKDIITFGETNEQHEVPFNSLLAEDATTAPRVDIDPATQVVVQLFSSGTTGLPKCVQHSHSAFVLNLNQLKTAVKYEFDERYACLLPFFHLAGMQVQQLLPPLYVGFSSYLPRFEPEMFLSCLHEKKVTVAVLVPPLVQFLATYPAVDNYDLTSIHTIMTGGAPLSKSLVEKFMKRFPHVTSFQQGYGLTETCLTTANQHAEKTSSVGHLYPNVLAKVVDVETGATLGPGQEGELCSKGPQVMLGYLNNPEATRAMITPDGWVHSGDIGYYTEDGALHVTDRIKDLIKYKAAQIAPAELEDLLLQHPGVTDAAVVGIPDDEAGEIPKAFVVKLPNSKVTEEELQKFVKERTSKTKWLRGGVSFIETIPKLASGKILKRVLREKTE